MQGQAVIAQDVGGAQFEVVGIEAAFERLHDICAKSVIEATTLEANAAMRGAAVAVLSSQSTFAR